MRQKPVTDDLDPAYLANVARVRAAEFFRDALRRAERCAQLIAELGEPLEADLPKGSIMSLTEGTPVERTVAREYLTVMLKMMRADNPASDADRFAHVSLALRGPKGRGDLTLFASAVGEAWRVHVLDVAVPGRREAIVLLSAESWFVVKVGRLPVYAAASSGILSRRVPGRRGVVHVAGDGDARPVRRRTSARRPRGRGARGSRLSGDRGRGVLRGVAPAAAEACRAGV